LESHCEQMKTNSSSHERKIDELQRQCSNEKLLRSTLAKLQTDFESKCDQTQKLTIDYEKQLKSIREELANVNFSISTNVDFVVVFSIEENFEIMKINIHN